MIRHFTFIALACLVLAAGCKSKEEKPTTEEAKQFALNLEKDAATRQINFLEKNILIPALMDRIFKLEEIKKLRTSKRGVQEGITQALKKHNYETTVFQSLGNTGTFRIVKQYEKDGKAHVIYRAFGEGGLNYFDMELAKIDKKTGIADIYLYTTGENISKSMGSMAEKIFNTDESTQKELGPSMITMKNHIAKGEYKEAKIIYDGLPEDMRNTKLLEALHISILPYLEGEDNKAEMERLEAKYSGDPSLQLMLIDVYLSKKDYAKALNAVDILDRSINKDPFLDYYRGLIYNIYEDKEKAFAHFEKAATNLPDFPDTYAELIALAADAGDKEKAKTYFKKYEAFKDKNPEVISYYQLTYPYLAE